MAKRYRIHLGDCLERMRRLSDASVDALLMDPPYCSGSLTETGRMSARGQGLRSSTIKQAGWFVGDNMGTAGLAALLRSVAFEATRVVKPSGSLLAFCDWRMLATLGPAIESAGLRNQGLVVWDKGSMGLGWGFRCRHELILHFTFGAPEYHDRSTPNVLQVARVARAAKEHQTEKPVELLERLIRVVAPPGGVVLDSFMGTGSTALACIASGRDFIGIERDPGYFAIAKRRIAEATRREAV